MPRKAFLIWQCERRAETPIGLSHSAAPSTSPPPPPPPPLPSTSVLTCSRVHYPFVLHFHLFLPAFWNLVSLSNPLIIHPHFKEALRYFRSRPKFGFVSDEPDSFTYLHSFVTITCYITLHIIDALWPFMQHCIQSYNVKELHEGTSWWRMNTRLHSSIQLIEFVLQPAVSLFGFIVELSPASFRFKTKRTKWDGILDVNSFDGEENLSRLRAPCLLDVLIGNWFADAPRNDFIMWCLQLVPLPLSGQRNK